MPEGIGAESSVELIFLEPKDSVGAAVASDDFALRVLDDDDAFDHGGDDGASLWRSSSSARLRSVMSCRETMAPSFSAEEPKTGWPLARTTGEPKVSAWLRTRSPVQRNEARFGDFAIRWRKLFAQGALGAISPVDVDESEADHSEGEEGCDDSGETVLMRPSATFYSDRVFSSFSIQSIRSRVTIIDFRPRTLASRRVTSCRSRELPEPFEAGPGFFGGGRDGEADDPIHFQWLAARSRRVGLSRSRM